MNQFWPIIIVLGLSAASWIFQRLKEQSEVKKSQDQLRRRVEDELRTGRAAPESQPTPRADAQALQDLAARRQAQLRELRMRQAGQGAGGPVVARAPQGTPGGPVLTPPRAASSGPIIVPGPGRPTAPTPRQPANPPSPGGPGRISPRAPRPTAPAAARPPSPQPVPAGLARSRTPAAPPPNTPGIQVRQPASDDDASWSALTLRTVPTPSTVITGRTTAETSGLRRLVSLMDSGRSDRERLAQAIVINELLSKPVSMREQGQDSW